MLTLDLLIRNGEIYDGQATWDSHFQPSSNLDTTTV